MFQKQCFIRFLVVFLSFTKFSTSMNCNFDVKMVQELRNHGFHRNLTYNIEINAEDHERWLLSDCVVNLDQKLPSGVFTNSDELDDLRRSQRVNAIPKNKVSVELPANQASPMSVSVKGLLVDGRAKVWLPVHARYHPAKTGGGFATNIIDAPKLLVRCPNDRLDVCDGFRTVFLCDGHGHRKSDCKWKRIPFTMMSPPSKWQVPVGNTDDYQSVVIGTVTVLVMGSIKIIMAILEYEHNRKYMNKKKR